MSIGQNVAARWLIINHLTHNNIGPMILDGEVHEWTGQVWRQVTRQEFYRHLTNPQALVTLTTDSAIAGAIKIVRNIVPSAGTPARGLSCRSGFVVVDLATKSIQLLPHDPSQFQTSLLDVDYDTTATAPLWLRTLHDVLDPSCIPTLQEAFGAAVMGIGTLFERAFALPGQGENGRSTILSVMRALFDPRVVKSIPPQAWSRDFQLAELAGARVNIVAEMPAREILDSERFKAIITGRDLITAERKYKDPFGFIPVALHIFAPNELPIVIDQTHGFWRRWIVIPFGKRIATPDRERDKRIINNELPGVLTWAIEGAERLVTNGDYTIPKLVADKKQDWRLQVDHVLRFVEEKCERVPVADGDRAEEVQKALHYYLLDQRVHSISVPKAGERLKAILGPDGEGWKRDQDGIRYAIKVDENLKMLVQIASEQRFKKGGM